MIPELEQLFSDFKFFNNILLNISEDITLENLLIELFKQKKLRDKNFYGFRLEKNFLGDSNFSLFYFELKNKKLNEYNPIRITIEKNCKNNIHKVVAIQYSNNEKTFTLSDSFNCSFLTYLSPITDKEIYFSNNLYDSFLAIKIKENCEKLSIYNSFLKITEKNILEDKKNNEFGNYFESIENVEKALSIINRILLLKCESVEQQEIDLLNNEFILEDCIYTSKLNKAEDVFKEEL